MKKKAGSNDSVTLSSRALDYYKSGNYKQALAYYKKAITAAHDAGDTKAEIALLRAMAKAYRAIDENAKADVCLKKAAVLAAALKKLPLKRVGAIKKTSVGQTRPGKVGRTRSLDTLTLKAMPVEKIPAPESTPDEKNYVVLKVFYATDRKNTGDKNPSRTFGRGRAENLNYGLCEVSIPYSHRIGEMESPAWWRLEFRPDPQKHIVLTNISAQDKDAYFSGLHTTIRNAGEKSAFIFIHGYNNTFQDAARRTAQMAYDLDFKGAPIFYSWPSQATLPGYLADENTVQWTEEHLKSFLGDVAEQSGAEKIFLIAHSMGNRALLRALTALMNEKPHLRPCFSELILAAPDVDAAVFKNQIAPWVAQQSGGCVTLYASAKDKALGTSEKIHGGYPRAGDTGENLVILPGVETIDATKVDTDFLGHGYFAQEPKVLSDIHLLIDDSKRAALRGLKRMTAKTGDYWAF
jgi:esterase/lipase superfamily enzyme